MEIEICESGMVLNCKISRIVVDNSEMFLLFNVYRNIIRICIFSLQIRQNLGKHQYNHILVGDDFSKRHPFALK